MHVPEASFNVSLSTKQTIIKLLQELLILTTNSYFGKANPVFPQTRRSYRPQEHGPNHQAEALSGEDQDYGHH